jgi:hypothetical protein
VFAPASNFYQQWLATTAPPAAALNENGNPPPEKLLQAVWLHQRLLRDHLNTLDGRPVRVLHPGFKNHEAGPDFLGAVIQFGSDAPCSGDVELDLHSSGWRSHGHDQNPAFRGVILHVVWEAGRQAFHKLPSLPLSGLLDAPLPDLAASLGRDSLHNLPEGLQGRCCAPLRELPVERLIGLLHEAALVRWQGRAAQFQARARQVGWEQALWEGLFRALGYKQNVWPMQSLAESRPHWFQTGASRLLLQSRLLGASGLLPDQLTRAQKSADDYLRAVWDLWWRDRDALGAYVLPRSLWRFNGLRPANHPQRRLALASHWLARDGFLAALEKWFTSEVPDARLASTLAEVLRAEQDDFWSWHWTIRSARMPRPQPLIGAARVTDLAVNIILPWFCIRAREGGSDAMARRAEERFRAWPAAEDNSLLKLARRRLLGGAKPGILPGAAAQQGLIQIVRDFCDHSNALCDQCEFPDLVRNWNAKP